MKKQRFKSVKKLSGGPSSFEHVHHWMTLNPKNDLAISDVRGLTEAEFEELSEHLAYHGAESVLRDEMNRALNFRVKFYIQQLRKDISKLGSGAFLVDQTKLESRIKMFSSGVETAMRRLWEDPNVIRFEDYDFQHSLNAVIRIRRSFVVPTKKWSQSVKHEIKRKTNKAIDRVKALQKSRYGSPEYKERYKKFVEQHFLRAEKIELTKFLTGVSSPRDVEQFDELRRNNMRYSKKSRKF